MRCGHAWSKLVGLCCVGLLIAGCSEAKPVAPAGGAGGPSNPGTPAVASADCEGAVAPSLETIEKGEYKPLSRPLFIYVNRTALQKPEVAGYVKTIFGAAQDQLAKSGGFIKLKDELLAEQKAKLEEAIKNVKIPEKIESGTVAVNGSSTVFPFSAVAAKLFEDANGGKVRVTIGKKGTGGGFEKFCAGESDINNASRPIKKEEEEKCKANNIEFVAFTVCIDGVCVCVNPKNDWCACLSVEQLKALFEPDSKVSTWKDLNPAWPDKKIKLYGPDTDSGTFEYFTEVTVGKAKSSRSDYTQSSEDNVLVRGVEGDTYALGYFGFSYFDKNRAKVKAVNIQPAGRKEEKKAEVRPEETQTEAAAKPEEKPAETKEETK